MAGGSAILDLTTETGTKVKITKSTARDGKEVSVTSKALDSRPSETKLPKLKPPTYFDVKILQDEISDGSANICITDASVKSTTKMQYWKKPEWLNAKNWTVSRQTICGDIPVSELHRTPIVIGT